MASKVEMGNKDQLEHLDKKDQSVTEEAKVFVVTMGLMVNVDQLETLELQVRVESPELRDNPVHEEEQVTWERPVRSEHPA